jgi:CheY-like chemotaxis protein
MSHILVVDDSPVERLRAGMLLEKETPYSVEYASDGIEALEHLEARLPLAVVTDLQMPDMDGMQLVRAVRRKYPKIPVILMTAYGSEDIALEALMAGAADYVPKSRLESDLPDSIASVLVLTVLDRPHKRLARCLLHEELWYELDNDVLLIPPLVEQLQHVAMDMDVIDQADALRFARSVMEALRNAIYHGNLELPYDQIKSADRDPESAMQLINQRLREAPYRDRRVHVHAGFTRDEARLTVRDEGPGFDATKLPNVQSNPMQLTEREGRGLVLIRTFMDETLFTPPGNEIVLIKRSQHRSPS